jgi:uncharacterized membrane protein
MDNSSSSTGLDPKVSALLAYLLGFVGGVVFYVISKDSYVKFHAMQSIMLSVVLAVFYGVIWALIIPFSFLFFLDWLLYLAIVGLWVFMMMKAYSGEKYKLPIIGDMAEKYAK